MVAVAQRRKEEKHDLGEETLFKEKEKGTLPRLSSKKKGGPKIPKPHVSSPLKCEKENAQADLTLISFLKERTLSRGGERV